MQYLYAHEARAVRGYQSYKPRKLTAFETALKQIHAISQMGENKVDKEAAIAQVTNDLATATASYTLRQRALESIDNKETLDKLIGEYPYVEFENISQTFTPLQWAAACEVPAEVIVEAVKWMDELAKLAMELPAYSNGFFVSTPTTNYRALRKAATGETIKVVSANGVLLPKSFQDRVDALFRDCDCVGHPLQAIKQYKLTELPDVWQRANVAKPFKCDVQAEETSSPSFWLHDDEELGRYLSLTFIEYPLLSSNNIKQSHHFSF